MPRGWVAVDARGPWGSTQRAGGLCGGSSGSESVPGGFWGTQGGRSASLTLEVGSELGGLACPRVLTDHLLEANVGDLDQVSCGEAALVPRDLVDGACRDTDSVSPIQRMPVTGGQGSVPPRRRSPHLCPHCSHQLECPSLSSLPSTHRLICPQAISMPLCLLLVLTVPLCGHSPQPPELNSYNSTDPAHPAQAQPQRGCFKSQMNKPPSKSQFPYCVLSRFSRVQPFGTLWTVSLQGSSIHEILQARNLEWVAMPSSRGSSPPRDRAQVSCIAGGFFTI